MATPIIQSSGSTSGLGTAGQGRNDLVTSETVSLSDAEGANGGASYSWVFEDIPIGSSTTLTAPTTATPSFVPDIEGSYRVKCVVDGTDESVEVLAVPLPNTGARIPSFEEQEEYDGGGNAKGWHEAMDVWMRAVDSMIGGGGGGTDTLALPEKWTQQNVSASQSNVDLFGMLSTSFDTVQAARAGSIVGLSTRFTQAITDATASSAVVTVTVNGTPGTLSTSHSSGANPSGGTATQASGIDTYVAGDLIGVEITTLGFLPATTDVEAWIEVEQ